MRISVALEFGIANSEQLNNYLHMAEAEVAMAEAEVAMAETKVAVAEAEVA